MRGYYHNHVNGVYGINFDVDLVTDEGSRVLKMTNMQPTGSPSSRAQATLEGASDDTIVEGSFHYRMKRLLINAGNLNLASGLKLLVYTQSVQLPECLFGDIIHRG